MDRPYRIVITESLLVPVLLLYVLLHDNNIGSPAGKFIFYIGLILAFFGDVLQVVINNQTFFSGSLVAFMLMNICYSISFYSLRKPGLLFFTIVTAFFLPVACSFILSERKWGIINLPLSSMPVPYVL